MCGKCLHCELVPTFLSLLSASWYAQRRILELLQKEVWCLKIFLTKRQLLELSISSLKLCLHTSNSFQTSQVHCLEMLMLFKHNPQMFLLLAHLRHRLLAYYLSSMPL